MNATRLRLVQVQHACDYCNILNMQPFQYLESRSPDLCDAEYIYLLQVAVNISVPPPQTAYEPPLGVNTAFKVRAPKQIYLSCTFY
jgi:hypothetical protein